MATVQAEVLQCLSLYLCVIIHIGMSAW